MRLALVRCFTPCWSPLRVVRTSLSSGVSSAVFRQYATVTPSDNDDSRQKLMHMATKLQQSPDFINACKEFNQALLTKGLNQHELTKPSIKLFKALMDRDIKVKAEQLAVALKQAGISDEEIKFAAQHFAGSNIGSGLFGLVTGAKKVNDSN